MDHEFKKDLNHSFLVLMNMKRENNGYQMKMLEKNTLQRMLPCTVRYVDEKIKYYYDISSKQPLSTAFSIQKMDMDILTRLFLQLEAGFHELEQYLLDSSGLILDVRYMYWDMAEEKLYMIYCPQVWETKTEDIRIFSEDLLNLIDYADKQAVDAACFFNQQTSIENFTFTEIFSYFHRQLNSQDEVEPEEVFVSEDYSLNESESGRIQSDNAGTERNYEKSMIRPEKQRIIIENDIGDIDNTGTKENKKEIQNLDWKRFLLVLAAGLVLLALTAKYLLTNYVLSEKEFLLGGGILAMLPAAYLVYGIRKQKSAKIRAQEEEDFIQRQTVLKEPEKRIKEETFSSQEDNTEQEIAYGETVYFESEQWQQERCLEGRVKGKPVSIFIHSFPFIIGKLPGAVSYILQDVTVSRMHAQFTEREGKLFLQDMNSKNGTYKNGVAMEASEAVEVFPGDEIRFGRLRFTYH